MQQQGKRIELEWMLALLLLTYIHTHTHARRLLSHAVDAASLDSLSLALCPSSPQSPHTTAVAYQD